MNKLLLILLAFSPLSFSKNVIDDVINYFDEQISMIQDLRQKNALIKSQTDLDFYSGLQDKSFPLNILDNDSKITFVESLRFNEKGITTFDYTVFNNLSTDDTYKVLSLFGVEHTSKIIHNSKLLREADHIGYECIRRATCKKSTGFICMSAC
ncbi:MAG: hypothetical protein L3J53_05000 [Proteobacteria bacterium]|nr:hypothetical protein [Pseudomonadota bacterium]